MFTGIVTDVGTVESIESRPGGDLRVRIATHYDPANISIGGSIACCGTCLTVLDCGEGRDGGWFDADISNESLAVTALGDWRVGTRINLERALVLGAEMGGHLMSGHVDGVADVVSRGRDGESERFRFRAPRALAPFIAAKGSAALDGTSLTINDVNGDEFGVNLVPHTLRVTTWGERKPGDRINLEIDMLARYVARLMEFKA